MLSKAISASAARSQVAIVGRSSKHCLLARSALASYGPRPSFLHVLLFSNSCFRKVSYSSIVLDSNRKSVFDDVKLQGAS